MTYREYIIMTVYSRDYWEFYGQIYGTDPSTVIWDARTMTSVGVSAGASGLSCENTQGGQ